MAACLALLCICVLLHSVDPAEGMHFSCLNYPTQQLTDRYVQFSYRVSTVSSAMAGGMGMGMGVVPLGAAAESVRVELDCRNVSGAVDLQLIDAIVVYQPVIVPQTAGEPHEGDPNANGEVRTPADRRQQPQHGWASRGIVTNEHVTC
jgi:hypothetical protein